MQLRRLTLLLVVVLLAAVAVTARAQIPGRISRPVVGPAPVVLDRALPELSLRGLQAQGKVVTPDKIPLRFGIAGREDPSKTRTPMPAAHIDDLTPKASLVSWRGKQIVVNDLRVTPVRPELPPVLMTIDQVERVARGRYVIHFSYSIIKADEVTLPVRFHLNMQGDIRMHMAWLPYVHESGPAANCRGRITADTVNDAPLMAASTSVGINAADSSSPPKPVGSVSKNLIAYWYKDYEQITRDDIKAYLERPGKALDSLGVDHGEWAVTLLQGLYSAEPALLLFKTSRGNFTKALLRAERDNTTKPYHLRIVSAYTYAKSQAEFDTTPGIAPGTPTNEEYTCHWEDGGYLLNTWVFDFDWLGMNVAGFEESKWQRDVWLQNAGGQQTIQCANGAKIAW